MVFSFVPVSKASDLLKMSQLAERSGVPASTIKHYLREGLLPGPAKKTGRNMAYYDPGIVDRIKAIKELQHTLFLPLSTIKQVLDGGPAVAKDGSVAAGIAAALATVTPSQSSTRAHFVSLGMTDEEFEWLKKKDLITPTIQGDEEVYSGDDLALCQVLSTARQSGLRTDMLSHKIIEPYVKALDGLVRAELKMFRAGVLPQAGSNLEALTEAAATLSESLILVLRRKLLLPILAQLIAEEQKPSRKKRARRKSTATKKRR